MFCLGFYPSGIVGLLGPDGCPIRASRRYRDVLPTDSGTGFHRFLCQLPVRQACLSTGQLRPGHPTPASVDGRFCCQPDRSEVVGWLFQSERGPIIGCLLLFSCLRCESGECGRRHQSRQYFDVGGWRSDVWSPPNLWYGSLLQSNQSLLEKAERTRTLSDTCVQWGWFDLFGPSFGRRLHI